MGSSELKKADIALSPLIGSQEDSLTKVLVGAADLALVDLDTLKSRKFDGAPLQAFLFSIPFGFGGIDQAYVVQDAALGSRCSQRYFAYRSGRIELLEQGRISACNQGKAVFCRHYQAAKDCVLQP